MEDNDFGEDGARPSSLIPVHKLSTPDPLHDLQLLRDVAIINEKVRRELGPHMHKTGHAIETPKQEDKCDVKLQHLAALAAAASAGAPTAWSTSPQASAEEVSIPAAIARYVDEDKALLAYKSATDGAGGKTTAIVLRYPKSPAPDHAALPSDREGYSCELVLLHEDGHKIRVTGRSRSAVDCETNQVNLMSTHLGLNDQLELSTQKVTFRNDLTPLGSYTTSFDRCGDSWHLATATYVYTDYQDESDEVLVVKEMVSYPKDIGMISIEKFDPEKIRDVLSKNKILVP